MSNGNLPETINFPQPPWGVVTVQKGQLGYKRLTRIRLRRHRPTGTLYFPIKGGHKYVALTETRFRLMPREVQWSSVTTK